MTRPSTTRIMLSFAVAVLFLAACKDGIVSSGGGRTVAVPFSAEFFTLGGLVQGDTTCGQPPVFLNTQEGTGEATHLGTFSTRITFCMNAADFLDGDGLLEGESLPYDRGEGTFTAANGDELYYTIEGAVVPTDRQGYNFQFTDPFTFTGGTGRFEGATGSGTTESYVIVAEQRTDHVWTGELLLRR